MSILAMMLLVATGTQVKSTRPRLTDATTLALKPKLTFHMAVRHIALYEIQQELTET